MAAVAWKPLFWERFRDAFALAGLARSRLAAVAGDLASPLRGGEVDRALLRIKDCDQNLAEASRNLGLAISALGVVELLALRCMRTGDTEEMRARTRARTAREMTCDAYTMVASSRGHLGAAGRLAASTVIPYHAGEDERVSVLAAIQAAAAILVGLQGLQTSNASTYDVALPRATSSTRSATSAPTIAGESSDAAAAWSSLADSTPGLLLRVALSGGVAELEAAQEVLRVGAEAIEKASKVDADALGISDAGDWSGFYVDVFRELDAAHAELSRILALKSESTLVLLRCAPQLLLNRGGQAWISWDASRADAERHGREALDHLWSVSAVVDYCLAGVLAWGTATSSGQEARELMRRAIADSAEARDAGALLRHAAGREFFHAWMLLKGEPSA